MSKPLLVISHTPKYVLLAKEDVGEKTRRNAEVCGVTLASRRHRNVTDDLLARTFGTIDEAYTACARRGLTAETYQSLTAWAKRSQ